MVNGRACILPKSSTGSVSIRASVLIICDPILDDGQTFLGSVVVNDIEKFKKASDVVLAKRFDDVLTDVEEKIYARDLFGRD